MRMDWKMLFSEKRERETTTVLQPHRNCFDMDYDRIVYSSSLRRLQDKAQVFPLQENDFTRTRLTHSLEVSAIGKSIGANVGYQLRKKGIFNEEYERKLSSLLLVAGLVHDLGNPPFGHYGEDVIKEWFKAQSDTLKKKGLDEQQVCDFCNFDGNAQTIRILTRLQTLNDKYGMNFCYGTLATIMKYPWSSSDKNNKKSKFGYFISEKSLCENILKETGVIYRHPATFLLEAADDIAYLFADLEDALKKHYLPLNKMFAEFVENERTFRDEVRGDNELIQYFDRLSKVVNNKLKRDEVSEYEQELINIQNFKVCGQGLLIKIVCSEFINKYGEIMEGNYSMSLLECDKAKKFTEYIRSYCIKYAYQNNEVLSLELVGKEVLDSLLDKFINAALDDQNYSNPKHSYGKIFALISENFKNVQFYDEEGNYNPQATLTPYQRVQMVTDFISGMTDSYALNLHKKLLGMKL